MGVCNCSMFCCTLFYVHSSIAIILMGKRELVTLLNLSSWCLVMVKRLFPWCHGIVCGLWLWYFLIMLTYYFWHLEGLNCISHIFSHCSRHARSVCRTSLSVVELIASYKAVPSAKRLTLDLTCLGRSFMHARKRKGPKTEPCGTPEETEILSECIPKITTACFRLSKKSFIHLRESPYNMVLFN